MFVPLLRDEDSSVRRTAVNFFAKVGTADPAIQQMFVLLLNDENRDVVEQIVGFFAMNDIDPRHTLALLESFAKVSSRTERTVDLGISQTIGRALAGFTVSEKEEHIEYCRTLKHFNLPACLEALSLTEDEQRRTKPLAVRFPWQ